MVFGAWGGKTRKKLRGFASAIQVSSSDEVLVVGDTSGGLSIGVDWGGGRWGVGWDGWGMWGWGWWWVEVRGGSLVVPTKLLSPVA